MIDVDTVLAVFAFGVIAVVLGVVLTAAWVEIFRAWRDM